jgi:hypothetical protein
MQVLLRGKHQQASDGQVFEDSDPRKAFEQALAKKDYGPPEPVITWQGKDEIAALDWDWHGGQKPNRSNVEGDIRRLIMEPGYSWSTHGGGARLIYFGTPLLTAYEQAALCIATVGEAFRLSDEPEINTTTRHPEYPRGDERCGYVTRGWTDFDRICKRLFGNKYTDDDDPRQAALWEEWLEEQGWEKGQDLEGKCCLIKPDHGEDGKKCVWVSTESDGIYCHKCNARGRCYPGVERPGWVPAALLVDSHRPQTVNLLRDCVKRLTHWEQAQYVLQSEVGPVREQKVCYRALLKLYHLRDLMGDDEETQKKREAVGKQINKTFIRRSMIRRAGYWAEGDLITIIGSQGLRDRLQALPATQYLDGESFKTDRSVLGEFMGAGDLTPLGYPPIVLIPGADMAEDVRPATGRIYVPRPMDPPFQRVKVTAEDLQWAEYVILRSFPGVRFDVVRLLLAGIGFAQRDDVVYPPMIYLYGPTGAGKSAHVFLAAELAGAYRDDCEDIQTTFNPDIERLQRDYNVHFPLCFIDEMKPHHSVEEVREAILSLKKGKSVHKLHCGPSVIGQSAAIVMADIDLHPAMRDGQLARRIVGVNLGSGIRGRGDNWEKSCGGNIAGWRKRCPLENTKAANIIISDVMDRFFNVPRGYTMLGGRYPSIDGSFADAARSLGFNLLIDYKDPDFDKDADLKELFRVVCAQDDFQDGNFKGKGWKVFKTDDACHNDLKKAFAAAVDGLGGNLINEPSWQPLRQCRDVATSTPPWTYGAARVSASEPRGSRDVPPRQEIRPRWSVSWLSV